MSLRELPVPFFDWKALYAERAEEYRRIVDETASAGGFILQANSADVFDHGCVCQQRVCAVQSI